MKKKLRYGCAFALTLLLVACSMISPEYHQPNVDVDPEWARFSNEKITMINSSHNESWWHEWHDQTLNQLISAGFAYSNTIGKAQANVEQAEGQLKAVQYSWIPGIDFSAGYSTDPSIGGPMGFYGINIGYNILNLFHLSVKQRAAEIMLTSQQEIVKAAKLDLVVQITSSYYSYIATVEQLTLYQQYQKDLLEMLAIKKDDTTGKINSDIPVEAATEIVAQAATQEKILRSNIDKSQNALRYLINKNPGKIFTKTQFSNVKTYYSNFAMLPAAVLNHRPDVAIAELQYKFTTQAKGLAYTGFLPGIKLNDFQGYKNVEASTLSGEPASNGNAYVEWSLDPAIFGDIKRLKGAEKAAYYEYIDTVRRALRDVDNALIDHATANKNYTLAEKAYRAAYEKYKLVLQLYETGIDSYASLLQEKIAMDQALLALNQAKLLQILTTINVYQNLGLY